MELVMEVEVDDMVEVGAEEEVVEVPEALVMVEGAKVARMVWLPPRIDPVEEVAPEAEEEDETTFTAPGYMLTNPAAIIAIATSAVRAPKRALSLTDFALSA